jgi:excisionase family DNA binding protein
MARTNRTTAGPADPGAGGPTARAVRGSSGASADSGVVALDEPLLDCHAAAALLNVRVSWVRDAARLGRLPCLRVGRHLRFTRVMLEDWLATQVESPSSAAPVCARPGPVSGGSGGGPGRRAYRRRTQAALLASLAERPTDEGFDDGR